MQYYITLVFCVLLISSCKQNDPITELGNTNGEFSAQLGVGFSNTRPLIGDTVVVTASCWQRDDKVQKVAFQQTIVESFGILMELKKGSKIETKIQPAEGEAFSTLILNDTLKNKEVWSEVLQEDLDKYWVTVSNNYVIRRDYELLRIDGKYPSNEALLAGLTASEFDVLKSILAYAINREDYLSVFPTAPNSHFTNGGTYTLSKAGIDYLKANLRIEMLQSIVKSLAKRGSYTVTIDVQVITPTGTITTATPRVFENNI